MKDGITLIALVITIIVLLILAGVAVSTVLNEGNLIEKANEAKASWNRKAEEENGILNGYMSYIDQYVSEGEEPITGTLELDYTLLADVENTYKKVTLSISGLDEATEQQILQAIADSWDNGSTANDIKTNIEEDTENGYYSNYNEGLLDYASFIRTSDSNRSFKRSKCSVI